MRRTICMILTAAAVLTLTGCGGGYDTYRLYPNEFLLGESVSDSAAAQGMNIRSFWRRIFRP